MYDPFTKRLLTSSTILAFSSGGNKLGISPLFNKFDISSYIDSFAFYESENINKHFFYSIPTIFNNFCISSTQYKQSTYTIW